MKKEKQNIKRKIRNSISILFIVLAIVIVIAILWFKETFSNVTIDELIFHLKVPLSGSNTDFIGTFLNYLKDYLIIIVILIVGLIIYQSKFFKHTYSYKLQIKLFKLKKDLKWNINDDRNYIFFINLILFIGSLIYCLVILDFQDYIKSSLNVSTLFEDYYVNPNTVKLEFPEQKQNLIYIYLESMESTFNDIELAGVNNNNLIPNLEKLAEENTHFSNTDSLGGAKQVPGTGWTIAAMVSQTAGIPLKIAIDGNSLDEYSTFLPGSYTLGDILKEKGYKQYLMVGSDITFGGRKNYFTQHGNYEIFDYNTAIEQEKIANDYYVWWGYEDDKLFEYAKEKLTEISKESEPFNFTLLTADTHFLEGYTDETCNFENENSYANAVSCSDQKVYQFVNWIKEQDFYKNTTIVISGDHLLMGNYLYPIEYEEDRRVYNTIINSKIETQNTTNRAFTTLDMFPTTLASLGVKIEGNRLGLGTNLFSEEKTISEEIGEEVFQEQLKLKSIYYNENILYGTK